MSKFNVGDKVKYIGYDHEEHPAFYPARNTIGEIVSIDECEIDCIVQWSKDSTSKDDCHWCILSGVELCEDKENEEMTNEEIWEMLLLKLLKNRIFPNEVSEAVGMAYREGYLRAMKDRPFKIGEKEKSGHWEPISPNNLPKDGTKVRYSRENIDWLNSEQVQIGDIGTVEFYNGHFGFNLDNPKMFNWICIARQYDCLDMWVEDDE